MKYSKFQEGMSVWQFTLVFIVFGIICAVIYGVIKLCKRISKTRYKKALTEIYLKDKMEI